MGSEIVPDEPNDLQMEVPTWVRDGAELADLVERLEKLRFKDAQICLGRLADLIDDAKVVNSRSIACKTTIHHNR